MDVRVVDVSNHQGGVDWGQVLGSGRHGGIVKATEGTSFIDGRFAANWAALGSLGAAVRGAYHFARPGSSTGAFQAQRFLSVVGQTAPRDLLVLDIEAGNGDLSAWALQWLATVEGATGLLPWVYSYGPFLRAHLTDPALARYPLWLAAYQANPPAAPAPWSGWRLWQHTNAASVPGIAGGVDESVGTVADPVPAPPSQQEVSGVNITAGNIPVAALDDQGRGWVGVPFPLARLLLVVAQGSAPARDGYWAPVVCNVNDSGPETIVTLAGQPHQQTVVYYAALEA